MNRKNLHAFKIQRNGGVNRQISRKLQFLFPLKTIWNNSLDIFLLELDSIRCGCYLYVYWFFVVVPLCAMFVLWTHGGFFYIFETGFHAFGVQSVNKLCTSHPKKPIPNYILWQILQALHFDTYDNCVEIFAYMKEFCSFLSRSLMLYIFIFRISFICGCCLFFFFLLNLRQHLSTEQT